MIGVNVSWSTFSPMTSVDTTSSETRRAGTIWVPPPGAEVEALLAAHPNDRPEGTRDISCWSEERIPRLRPIDALTAYARVRDCFGAPPIVSECLHSRSAADRGDRDVQDHPEMLKIIETEFE